MGHRHKDSREKWTTTDPDTPLELRVTKLEGQVKLLLAAAGGGGGTTPLPPNPEPPPDVTAPNFTATVFGTPTQTTIPFTWTTDEAAKVRARYGTTTAMSSSTALSGSFATSGGDTITGLTAGTLYYVRLDAVDAAGNPRQGSVRTITTAGTVVVPPPPPPPPPLTGVVINPGTGTIAAAIANGDRDLILRGGTYKDSFGSTQRTDDCILRNYPGETPVIDGTGLLQNFLYLGSGAAWEFTGIRIQGFRPVDSGVIGVGAGSLTLTAVTMQGLGALDDNVHNIYCFGNGTTIIRQGCHILGAPGAAITTYFGAGAITPTVTISDSELVGLYRGGLFYDAGTITAINSRFFSSSGVDIERLSSVPVTLTNCQGGGSGTPPAVRIVVT